MLGRPSLGFTFGGPAIQLAKDDVIIVEPGDRRLRAGKRAVKKAEETREPESQESLTFTFGTARLNSGSKPEVKTDAKKSDKHEITISGLLVKDVSTRHIFNVQKTVFVYNKADEDQEAIVEEEMERLKEESSLLKTHFFNTKIEVPESFLPTVVGGLTEKFKVTSIAKMVKAVQSVKRSKKRRMSP